MEKENENTHIIEADLQFLEKELAQINTPMLLRELVTKTAFKKTSGQLSLEAKKYDPDCVYEVGDLVYKEYDEPLTVSSKGAEPFQGSVVLKIINKIALSDFNCEMLEVDFNGGGTFRKHIDYMRKTNTQVLLPSNCDGKAKTPEILKKEDDPRLNELPMTEKDLKKLEKNLKSALIKSGKFFNWNDYWQLEAKRFPIKDKEIKSLDKHFLDAKTSATTSDLVIQFFGIKPDDDAFALHCLSLNYVLEKEHKKTFAFISPEEWGKWFSKAVLDSFLANLPLTKPKAKVPAMEEETCESLSPPPELPLKLYLTWREVLSGCVKIPKSMNRHFSQSREYIFTDTDGGKSYIVYYYPSANMFFGLKDFYEKNNVPQGASLTIEKKDMTHCNFSLKKSKKKLEVPVLSYDETTDKIQDSGEEAFTFSLPNKIIFLERETLNTLFALSGKKVPSTLKDLLILVFKHFGLEGETLAIHYMRAFHLIDVLKRTSIEDVEKVLLNSAEFTQSEKSKGLFSYRTEEEILEEVSMEELAKRPPKGDLAVLADEAEEEILPEIGTVGEIAVPEGPEIIEIIEPEKEVQVEERPQRKPAEKAPAKPPAKPARRKKEIREAPKEEKAPPIAPKKEKPAKKKKGRVKIDLDKTERRRKGERRIIEERIEWEESEMEALFAKKGQEDEIEAIDLSPPLKDEELEDIEAATEDKKGEIEEYVSESPMSSIFADKLQSALSKQKTKTSEKEKKGRKRKKK